MQPVTQLEPMPKKAGPRSISLSSGMWIPRIKEGNVERARALSPPGEGGREFVRHACTDAWVSASVRQGSKASMSGLRSLGPSYQHSPGKASKLAYHVLQLI
eukprot:2679086-Rhodomonas_salina.1